MNPNLRVLDSNENVFLGREVEKLDPRNFMTLFAGLYARRFVPTIPGIQSWQEAYSYVMYTMTGQAKRGAPGGHAKDMPTVNWTKKKYSRTIKSIPAAYQWTIDEIRAAANTGVPLEQMSVQGAMNVIMRAIDEMLAFGDAGSDITGLLNNPEVDDTLVPVDKTGGGKVWTDASQPKEWIADINILINGTRDRLQQASEMNSEIPVFDKFVILAPQNHYQKMADTPRSDNSDTTVLQWLLKNNPWIESIEEWYKCGTADDGDPQLTCYPRQELAVGGIVPTEFESFNPQESGLDIVVPCRGKCGGVVMRYPVAVSYLKGV